MDAYIDDGGTSMEDWSVVNNYRSRLMQPGDRILFWVTSGHEDFERGIWGVGYVTGYAHDTVTLDNDNGDDYFLDDDTRVNFTNMVPVDIPLLAVSQALTDRRLRLAGLNDLEVQIQPFGSNPSWVSKEQLARIDALVEDQPEYADPGQLVAIQAERAGFGDLLENLLVDTAAKEVVNDFFESDGWIVEDVSADRLGWDLTCTGDGETAQVKVAGLSGDRHAIVLTPGEFEAAGAMEHWRLVVVIRALTKSQVVEYSAAETIAATKPFLHLADFSKSAAD